MKHSVIIVAGGSGQRMESSIPKQFLEINKEIILMKSIRSFYEYDSSIEIIVALPKNQISQWKDLCNEYKFTVNHSIVKGGQTRYHSVKNALEKTGNSGIIAVHDGVRPLVSQATINKVFENASNKGNAIPFINIVDSVRFVDAGSNKPVDRNKYKLIQTPQAFDCEIIKSAYEQEWQESFTDDASIVEKSGVDINLVPGNIENIKITTKTDLKIAETLYSYLVE